MDRESQTRGPRACITCAKAKSRCIPGPKKGACERCHRLGKPCSAQTPAPPRKRKAPRPTRVADLERRLEDLTARVGSQAALVQPLDGDRSSTDGGLRSPPQKRISTNGNRLEPNDRHRLFDHVFSSGDQAVLAEQTGERRQPLASSDSCRSSTDIEVVATAPISQEGQAPNTEGASELVPPMWRAGNTHFPFSYEFANEKQNILQSQSQDPYTSTSTSPAPETSSSWRSKNPGVRSAQANAFSTTAQTAQSAPRVVGDPWYYPASVDSQRLLSHYRANMAPQFPFVVPPPDMTSAQLRMQRPLLWKAIMTASLQLDAARQLCLGRELLNDIVVTSFLQPKKSFDILQALQILISWYHIILKSFQMTNLLFLMRSICISLGINESLESSEPPVHSSASLDQMRTYAGVYYLVTMVFTTNKKHDAFMNTSYLSHCCQILEEKMEYPSDQLVVLLVRTQQISQSISMTLAFRNNSLPLTIIVKSFQHEIDQLRASVAAANQDDVGLQTQIKIAEILLYEVGLHEELAVSLAPPERLEILWRCLQATRTMLDLRFSQPYTPFSPQCISLTSFDYTFAMLTCLRLSVLNLPGWDLRLVRGEVDFNKYLTMQQQILKTFAEARREAMIRGAGGDGQERRGDGDDGRQRTLPPGFVDPYERLQLQIAQLGAVVKAELAATMPPDIPPPSRAYATVSVPGEERTSNTITEAAGGTDSDGSVDREEIATTEDSGPAPDFRDDLDEIVQTFHQSFWQDMDRVDDDWGADFNAFMWGRP